jgi:hypothetical protein
MNQLMFGIWDGGTLSLNLTADDLGDVDLSSFGVSDLSVQTTFMLPLTFNSCFDGEQSRVQIGDLYIDATLKLFGQDAHIAFWVQGEAPANIVVTENEAGESELGFELLDLDPVYLEVAINEGLFAGNDDAVITLVKEQLLPQMLGSLTGGLGGFSLPSIDLSSISPDIPEGTAINLSFDTVERSGAYSVLKGELK